MRCEGLIGVLLVVLVAGCADDGNKKTPTDTANSEVLDVASDLGDVQPEVVEDTLEETGLDTSQDAVDVHEDLAADVVEDTSSDVTTADTANTDTSSDVITSCADLSADSCLSNLDCNNADRCESFSQTNEFRCCVPGQRGSGEAGASCVSENDCAFGRCMERDDGARFCSGSCTSDLECPLTQFCSDLFSWCVPKDAGAPPTQCSDIAASQCFLNDNCQADERCEDVGGVGNEVLCCTVGARGTGLVGESCTSELDCSFGRCFGGLCSEACDFGVDPCPPATMLCNTLSGYCEPI